MRKLFAITILLVLTSCSLDVVPDPTQNGVQVTSGDSAILGSWSSKDTAGGHTYWHRLTLSSKFWYERTLFDSVSTGTTITMDLYEWGTWSWSTQISGDSSHLVLLPSYRQIGTVAQNLPDTAWWVRNADTLQWILPKWNQRNDSDTIKWRRN